jgi:hypothetical protein
MSRDALWPELAARIDGEVQADPVTRMLYAVDASTYQELLKSSKFNNYV